MSEPTVNLFVYGTLMRGEANFVQIERFARSIRPGTVEGVLVDLGAYPALVAGEGRVRGVVLEIEPVALEITDRIESYHPERRRCLYLRQEMVVLLDTRETVAAWAYFFANPNAVVDCPRLVVAELDGKPVFAWRCEERHQQT